jgi:hypothetical protein
MHTKQFEGMLVGAVAVPALVVALLTGASGVSAYLFDRPLILAPVPRSAAEAAGNRDAADLVLLSRAEDMNRATLVRIPLRLHAPATLTALEAAVVSERAYMITIARDRGAQLDPPTLRRLRCVAQARKDRGTIAYLAALDSAPLDCRGVDLPY